MPGVGQCALGVLCASGELLRMALKEGKLWDVCLDHVPYLNGTAR